jgi:adenylylsulfate reductase subunit B
VSIEIRQDLCVACGECAKICPGSLIRMNDGKAVVPRPERCWGCAACVKACPAQAVALFLGADMGGLGGRMTARREGTALCWTIAKPDGSVRVIRVDSRDSNRY